ncbi:MAG: STAS domain-containing protein [Gammaproteobacteria bacterium]|nr:STAS domain-containing protein [Gammaproteobacteria bacterium]
MAKKSVKKTTKKVAAKKKSTAAKKVMAKPKKSPFKSKLGHDPLSWITGEDANEYGVSFDDIGSGSEAAVNKVSGIKPDITVVENENALADEGWGLFDDEPSIVASSEEESNSDDGSWGLFSADDDSATDSALPVGEGVAWGLFEENTPVDSDVDSDALVVNLPAAFNVAHINKVYHDFEMVIDKSSDIIVDASEVETIDATGLQLLFATQKELQKRDCKLVIKDASEKIELLSSSSFLSNLLNISG